MNVGVTGANGFIGREIAATLRSAGHDVHALVRNVDAATTPARHLDLARRPLPPGTCDGLDAVVHCAAHLPTSKVVKAFNAIQAAHIVTEGRPAGADDRRALAIAGDDADAKEVVTDLIESFGFDVVDAGPLAEGWRFDRDRPAYGAELGADALREALAAG
jgi:uncharacterized protein YbjT (DUF2867 family)